LFVLRRLYLDNAMSDISEVYAKSRSNSQRNSEETRRLEWTWKQKPRDTASAWWEKISEKRRNLKDSVFAR
jgi:hypothetical protein